MDRTLFDKIKRFAELIRKGISDYSQWYKHHEKRWPKKGITAEMTFSFPISVESREVETSDSAFQVRVSHLSSHAR